ncbi:MAG: hypothetical protein H7224_08585 [Polaromonas sp.]|nr:hypothetical protein [Polaromonas sp.]
MEQQDRRGLALNMERFKASGEDALNIARAVVSTWTEISQVIAPVVGARGVFALYERSLYLTRSQHPWIASVQEHGGLEVSLVSLETVLAQKDCATAAAGGTHHLQTFYEVLSSLIGPSLTDSLLRSIWENSTNGPSGLDSLR